MSTDLEPPPPEESKSPSPQLGDSPYSPDRPDVIVPLHRHLKISAYWFATNFLWGALISIMLPSEMRHLVPHMHILALSVLMGFSAGIAIVVPLVAGALSDRCMHPLGRRRPYIVTGVAINLVGLMLMDLAYKNGHPVAVNPGADPSLLQTMGILLSNPSYLMFLGALMVVQFGNNVATAAYSGIIPDLIPANQRGAASGYMALMSQAGTLFGALGCGLLLASQTETVKYLVISTVLGGVALITVMGVHEPRLMHKPPPMKWGEYARSLWIDPKKYPDFAWVWITRALVMIGFYAVIPFINDYLRDVIGFADPDKDASILTGVILLFASVSGIVAGYVSDRVGRKRTVYIANTSMAVVGLGFIFCMHWWQVLVVGILFGLGYGAYISVDWALGTDVLPSKTDAAKEMAVWHIAMTLPQAIAAPIAGSLIEVFGKSVSVQSNELVKHYTLKGYSAIFIMAAGCFALGAVFLRNVRGVK